MSGWVIQRGRGGAERVGHNRTNQKNGGRCIYDRRCATSLSPAARCLIFDRLTAGLMGLCVCVRAIYIVEISHMRWCKCTHTHNLVEFETHKINDKQMHLL